MFHFAEPRIAETPVSFIPGPGAERKFRDALGRFGTGVTVVTTLAEGLPVGMTVNSFASVSLDPPLILWSAGRRSRRFAAFVACEHFAVHVLGAEQADLAARFARAEAGFDGLTAAENAQGVPLLAGCLARFECARAATHDGGDHAIIVGRVTAAESGEGEPLLFWGGGYGRFAPTGRPAPRSRL